MSRIIRIQEVKDKTGYKSNSSVYAQIENKTLVPPVKIGKRASGWIEHEVDAVISARIAGKTEKEIQVIVRSLVEKRIDVAGGFEL